MLAALELSTAGIYRWNLRTNQVWFSEHWGSSLGYASGEVKPTLNFWKSLIHPDDRLKIETSLEAYLDNPSGVYEQEYRLKRKDGGYRWTRDRGRVVQRDERDQPLLWIGVDVDIHESYRRREELIHQKEETQFLLDAIPNLVILKDHKARVIRMNQAAADSAGIKLREAIGKQVEDIFPNEADLIRERDDSVLNKGQARLNEIERIHIPNRGQKTLLTDRYPIKDPDQNVMGLLTVRTDVTYLKETEEALRISEQRLRLALSGANVGLWDWDFRTGLVFTSPELSAQLGRENAFDSYEEFIELLHPDDREPTDRAVNDYLENRRADYDVEFRLRHRSGDYRWLHSIGRAYRDDDGKPMRMIGIHIDITERKQTSADLERYTEELERSNAELDQFAYVASHDLRSPLRGIKNLSKWIEEDSQGQLKPNVEEHLTKLKEQVELMDRMLVDLLDYSRASRATPRPETFTSDELMREVLGMATLPDGFEVRTEVGECGLHTGRSPLQRVLLNLLTNAAFHHDRAAGTITVSMEREREHWAHFRVADDGPGIEPRQHDAAFQMFHRGVNAKGEGSGMGLAIVKRLVNARGGEIWIESDGDRGTAIHFTWPTDRDLPDGNQP